MFNKTTINQSKTEHVPFEKTVKEFKAPTDESIKLLNEFEEKAYQNLLRRTVLNDNVFNCAMHIRKDFREMAHFIDYKIMLNGKEHLGSIPIPYEETRDIMPKVFNLVRGKIQQIIYDEVVDVAANALQDANFFKPLKETVC